MAYFEVCYGELATAPETAALFRQNHPMLQEVYAQFSASADRFYKVRPKATEVDAKPEAEPKRHYKVTKRVKTPKG